MGAAIPAIFEAAPPDSVLQSSDRRNANEHLAEIDHQAERMFQSLVKSLSEQENVTEKLKANRPMEWVQKMNNIRNRAAEIINSELIYI